MSYWDLQQRASNQRVGMVADIAAISSLDHRDAGIVPCCDYPYRHAGKQLAHNRAMTQGVRCNLGGIKPALLGRASKKPTVIRLSPGGSAGLDEKRRLWRTLRHSR